MRTGHTPSRLHKYSIKPTTIRALEVCSQLGETQSSLSLLPILYILQIKYARFASQASHQQPLREVHEPVPI